MKRLPVLSISLYISLVLLLAACAAPAAAPSSTEAVLPTSQPTAAPTETALPEPSPTVESTEAALGALQYTLVADQTEARYRVREQLVNVSLPNDAIGKTSAVSGSVRLQADGSIDAVSSRFVVDAGSLVSDRSMRDNYVRRNTLKSDQFPEIVFVPTQVSGLTRWR